MASQRKIKQFQASTSGGVQGKKRLKHSFLVGDTKVRQDTSISLNMDLRDIETLFLRKYIFLHHSLQQQFAAAQHNRKYKPSLLTCCFYGNTVSELGGGGRPLGGVPGSGQESFPYEVCVTRREDEGFGFVIISSITRAGSVIGMYSYGWLAFINSYAALWLVRSLETITFVFYVYPKKCPKS